MSSTDPVVILSYARTPMGGMQGVFADVAATEEELKAWVGTRLAKFKIPVKIIFCADILPRNANGKIMKRDLKALF